MPAHGHAPERDRGPVRRYVRNIVDSRFNIGEVFLPLVFVVLVLSLTRNQNIAVLSIIFMYLMLLSLLIDGFFLSRRIKRMVSQKFPNESTRGLAMYAILRGIQMRRMRVPKPQIERGSKEL